nr:transglycosylase domain-containing protein [Saprospiraceae bacterium]
EMIIARRLEKIYDKKELLKLYLNTVPFSDNAFGIKAAARHFFGVLPKELKKEEAALLIGTLKATTFYNPIKYPERATQRRNIVLKQMEKYGDPPLPKAESDSLQKLALGLNIQKDTNYGGIAGYFKEHLRSEFEELMKDHKKQDGSSYNLYDDGLKIYTTLDSHMQRYAEEAVAEHIKELQKTFDRDWKGVKDELPWTDDKFIEEQIVRSERYKQLKTQNKSDAEIKTVFDTPTEMTVFSWDKGEEVKKMTPRDSIKYYFCLLNAGFVAMNPKNGAILAWVGGTNYKYFQYDCVKAKRQVGSAFKPIVYARAIEKGIDPCTMFPNQLTTYPQYDNWQPENVDKKYGGRYSMEGGIAKSINCVAVEVIMKGGIDSTRILANDMGITSKVRRVPAIALGAVDATLYDMIKVYGTFANGGLRPDIRIIEKIVAQDGTVILDLSTPDATAKYPRIISKHTADVMQHLLTAVVRRGTAEALPLGYGINNIAGKTGTSQSQADGWFIGYTPTVVVGAWVGAPSPAVHFRSEVGQGSRTALPVCGKFLHKVYNDKVYRKKQAEQFPPFGADMDEVLSCPRNDWELQYLIEQDSILIAENGVLVDSAGNVIGAGNGASTRGYYKPELAGKPVEEATDKTKNLKPEKKDSTALKVKNIKSEKKDTIRIEQKR